MRPKFWIVLGVGVPTYRHTTKESAKTEAARLAACCPGQEFVVLEALAIAKKSDVAWEICGDESPAGDEIPF